MSWGEYASSQSDGPAAPIMQGRSTGGVTTGTSMTVTLPASVASGELLIVGVAGSRTSSPPTTVLATYTKLAELFQANSTSGGFLSIWGKIAGVGEGNPSFSVTATNTNMTYIAERWSGAVMPGTQTPVAYTTAGGFTMTSNAITTTVANSIVLTFAGGRFTSTGNMSQTWGGGATGAYDTASGRIGALNNATELFAATGSTGPHTCAITNSQGSPVSLIASIIISPA